MSRPRESRLFQLAKARLEPMQIFQRYLDKWTIIARELGTWCSDQYLIDIVSEKRYRKYELKTEQRVLSKFRATIFMRLVVGCSTALATFKSSFARYRFRPYSSRHFTNTVPAHQYRKDHEQQSTGGRYCYRRVEIHARLYPNGVFTAMLIKRGCNRSYRQSLETPSLSQPSI